MFHDCTLSVGDEEKVLDIGVLMVSHRHTYTQKGVCEKYSYLHLEMNTYKLYYIPVNA